MPRSEEGRRQAEIRAMAYGNGAAANGQLTYLDSHDLKPRSVFNAAIAGATAGAMGGGFFAGIPLFFAHEKSNGNTDKGTEVKLLLGGTAAGAVIGATTAVINARIHNKWADKMTTLALEKQHNGYVDRYHSERADAGEIKIG